MANTYTQLYVHGVFAVRSRQNLIFDSHAEEIRKYMCRIVTNLGSKPIAVNTMPILRTLKSSGISYAINLPRLRRFRIPGK
jgi:hypothetical protein